MVKDNEKTSKSKFFNTQRTALSIILFGLLMVLAIGKEYSLYICIVPFFLLCILKSRATYVCGAMLAIIYSSYLLLLTYPLQYIKWIGPLYSFIGLFSPLFVLLTMDKTNPSPLTLTLQTILWDIPQLLWARVMSFLHMRALEPFCSIIDEDIAVGSVPLGVNDVLLLKNNTNYTVHGVVNMCREYNDCEPIYAQYDILQCYCPTPDFVEPSIQNVVKAIRFILYMQTKQAPEICDEKTEIVTETVKESNSSTSKSKELHLELHQEKSNKQKRVYIHCKGGRGRAVTIATCYLLYKHRNNPIYTIPYVIEVIKQKRSCASVAVAKYKVVHLFNELLKKHGESILDEELELYS